MKRMSLLLLILAAACGSGTDPEPAFSLSFNAAPADTIVDGDSVIFTRGQLGVLDDLRPINAEVAVGTIRILGSYVAPCSGPQPSADVSRSGNSVALSVDFRPAEGTCAGVVQPWTYEARLTQVPSNAYELRVEHHKDQLREDGVVLEQQVEVP